MNGRETVAPLIPSKDHFGRFASSASTCLGSRWAFAAAIGVIAIWAITGPLYHYSNTWQLIINTGTTIVTFLMVFLIQNTQNRDARAINLKLDELIHAIDNAKDQMIDIEHLSDAELDTIAEKYKLRQPEPVKDIDQSEAPFAKEKAAP
ncbi:MAG: low affinity iron permease family protein [Edaphobacter sp.]